MAVRRIRRDEGLGARIVRSRPLVDPRTGEHVGAASAAVLCGGRLFAVQDDALSGVWIDPVTLSLSQVVLLGRGERLPKKKKPDFEAAFATADGTIFVLGSGGTDRRKRIVRYQPRSGEIGVIDAGALFDAIAARLGCTPNIEGAAPSGDVVRLFHRGNGKHRGPSASLDVTLATLQAGRGEIVDDARYDLGTITPAEAAGGASHPYRTGEGEDAQGVALSFTDVTRLDGERLLFLAAAEDSEDAIADGPVLGGAVGVLEGDGGRYALLTEADGEPSRRKIEGVALVPGKREAFVVTDPDDPERPSELCTVALEGRW